MLLDTSLKSGQSQEFELGLRRKIIGQDEAVQAIVDMYQVFLAGMNAPDRPIANFLFLGPTGVGKTRCVEAASEIIFGHNKAILKIDCAEFQHSHEIAKLIGSPPGYLGHRETHALLTQEALDKHHTILSKISFLLFDEIEKSSDALWSLLLGVLDKATLTLGDNTSVDFSKVMIFLTSNLGGSDITELMTGGLGFIPQFVQNLNKKVTRTAEQAARKKFLPEFMNRIDKIVVFHSLEKEQLNQILELELAMVQQRVLSSRGQCVITLSATAKNFLIAEGTDTQYGARHLKRAIERFLVFPLANLISTNQVSLGDTILIDFDGTKLVFYKEQDSIALVKTAIPGLV